jgi:hypothetical protein
LTLKEHAFAIEDAIESKELHPPDTFILNVDAAVSSLKATVAVVARDLNGNLIMAWAKQSQSCDPMVAESSAINGCTPSRIG